MRTIPSRPWIMGPAAVVTLMALASLSVAAVPAVEAQQSSAAEEEQARVRAELQARLQQLNEQVREQMRALEGARASDVEGLQRRLEELVAEQARVRQLTAARLERVAAEQARVRELTAERLERAAAQQARVERAAIARQQEAMERAMVEAQRAERRARSVNVVRSRAGCEVFGDTVLDRAEELALNDDQVERIREAQRATRRNAIERNADIEIGEMDLEALYEADQPDLAAIRAKLEELALLGVDHEMAGFELREQVRAILTPEQREQLDDLRGDDNVSVVFSSRGIATGSVWRMGNFGC